MKFASLALIGAAAAHPMHHGHHHVRRHHTCPIKAFVEWIESFGPHRCGAAPGHEIANMHELRLVAQASVKSWAKGYYQESGDVVSDECFGEWMHDSFQKIKNFIKTWKDDPLAVPLEDYYAISKEVVDLLFKNKDTCQINKQVNDFKVWCSDNEETCLLGEGMEQRIVENSVDIVGTLIDIFHILERDDTCYTSKEQLDQYSRFVKDLGELSAATTGFDLKWDQSKERRHIKRSAFRTAVRTFYHRKHMTPKQIMELDFPELSHTLEDLFKALHEFKHAIFTELHKIVREMVQGVLKVDKELTSFLMPNFSEFNQHGIHHREAHRLPTYNMPVHHEMPAFTPFEIPSFGGIDLFPVMHVPHYSELPAFPNNLGGLF